jgi:hypothetical protein
MSGNSGNSKRDQYILALIGGSFTVIVALIGNWEKLEKYFPGSTTSSQLGAEASISGDSRFYCEFQPDLKQGGKVWTVIYRSSKGDKPWLRMIRSMGDGWDTESRCREIAARLETYAVDGLLSFKYRRDSATPRRYVICARTKKSGDDCPLVLTLLPQDDPNKELKEVAGALLHNNLPSYQCSEPKTCPEWKPETIELEDQL